MEIIPMHKAKTTLSQLVKRASAGETILIGGYGRPEAALTSIKKDIPKKRIGILAGKITVPEEFDAPLPSEILNGFLGEA